MTEKELLKALFLQAYKVIDSCTNFNHLVGATQYICFLKKRLHKKYGDKFNKYIESLFRWIDDKQLKFIKELGKNK